MERPELAMKHDVQHTITWSPLSLYISISIPTCDGLFASPSDLTTVAQMGTLLGELDQENLLGAIQNAKIVS